MINESRRFCTVALCLAAVLILMTIGTGKATSQEDVEPAIDKAVAVLHGTEGNEGITGHVTFTQQDDGVLIEAHINGLEPNSTHGFHIHEFGDLSAPDGTSLGGHFNPDGKPHGGPDDEEHHVGDLGNITADENGHAMYRQVDPRIQIHGEHSILGRGVVVHGGADDLESQPSGAAGPRIAVGAIGVAQIQ